MLPLVFVLLQTPSAVTLRYQPALNKTYKYTMNVTGSQAMPGGKPMTLKQESVIVMKAVSRVNGRTKVLSSVESAKVTVPSGSPMAPMAKRMEEGMRKMRSEVTMDLQGKIVSSNMGGQGGMVGMAQNPGMMQTFAYPKTPVKVGSTWSIPLDLGQAMKSAMPGASASGKIPIVMKVTKISRQGSKTLVQLAVGMKGDLKLSGEGQTITSKISGAGSLLVDAANGMPISQQMRTTTVTPFGGQKMTQVNDISMKLR